MTGTLTRLTVESVNRKLNMQNCYTAVLKHKFPRLPPMPPTTTESERLVASCVFLLVRARTSMRVLNSRFSVVPCRHGSARQISANFVGRDDVSSLCFCLPSLVALRYGKRLRDCCVRPGYCLQCC